MKVFLGLLSLCSAALASLEPAGYQPPGQYLPPQQRQQQRQPPSSSQYLPPPSAAGAFSSRQAASAGPSSQYLPARSRQRQQQQQQQQQPSRNYLPVTEKARGGGGGVLAQPSVVPPSSDYLPPPLPQPAVTAPRQQQPAPVSNDYLPPLTRIQVTSAASIPTNDYLPPVTSAPQNDYLPPPQSIGRQPAIVDARTPTKSSYLPPSPPEAVVRPKSDYLPPSSATQRLSGPTTPKARIQAVTGTPYSHDGSVPTAYRKPAKFGLAVAATTSPAVARSALVQAATGYPGASAGLKGYEQPADNYLPPHEEERGYASAEAGYRYGAAGARSYEQSTEPAKYDFEYRVSDEFGNDYAHKESRAGAQTQGFYSVLLPDGRKQIVHYEADEGGFKPRISYEAAASVLGPKAAVAGVSDDFAGYGDGANGIEIAGASGPY